MSSASPSDQRSGYLVSRLSALERENVELQEEVLSLKKEIMAMKTAGSHSRPSTPTNRVELQNFEGFQEIIDKLKSQVVLAVSELQKYRLNDTSGSSQDQNWSVEAQDSKSAKLEVDDFDKLLDSVITPPAAPAAQIPITVGKAPTALPTHPRARADSFFDDLLS